LKEQLSNLVKKNILCKLETHPLYYAQSKVHFLTKLDHCDTKSF
jgi:hypothetical protein